MKPSYRVDFERARTGHGVVTDDILVAYESDYAYDARVNTARGECMGIV